MKFPILSSIVALPVLLSVGSSVAAEEPVARASCVAGAKQASIRVDASGEGLVEVTSGADDRFSCALALTELDGPPFSDSATGMLALELSRSDCSPAEAERRVHREVYLHLSDVGLPSQASMAVIERRVGVFQCQIERLDMDGLAKLHQQLTAGASAEH